MPIKPPTFDEMPEGTHILTQEGEFVKQAGEMVPVVGEIKVVSAPPEVPATPVNVSPKKRGRKSKEVTNVN